ncbi:hypothetical protein [Kibdelosporangium aridum]|uniref:hypothetical protein n=1 Tax=Kibdelosporangium aridum TaxID=2030 RepID=UPI0035EAF887
MSKAGKAETVVVLVTGSGQARGALPMLRRLVTRFLLVAGFTAACWLASVLLTSGTASADLIKLPEIPGVTSSQQQSTEKPAKKNTTDLVDGLLGGVTSTLNDTLGNVTTTVNNTVGTVTKTVTKTVGNVTKTVDKVVDTVTDIPPAVLPPSGNDNDSLLPKPVTDLLTPEPKNSGSDKDTSTARDTVETVTSAPEAVPQTPEPAAEAPAAERPRLQHEARRTQAVAHPVRVGSTQEKAAPADKKPGPLPGPSGPVAPAAPAPTASAGGNGGWDARGMLAVLIPQTSLVPPHAGLLHATDSVTEVGRSAGLPATPPD